MKKLILLSVFVFNFATAAEKIDANFNYEEVTKIIDIYAKASGKKFIVDSTVRGKITILNPGPISVEEFFNQLSAAMAVNGFAILNQEGVMIVKNARSAQRDYIETSTKVPSMHPTRMFTWIHTLKYLSASDVQKDIRILMSSYGEMTALGETNQLLLTDWTPNIVRISEMMKIIDQPVSPATKKLVSAAKKARPPIKKVQIEKAMEIKEDAKEE